MDTDSINLFQEFPGPSGFSVANLKYMKRFYVFYSELELLNRQQVADELERLYSVLWGHHILFFSKCDSIDEALFYIHKTIENGWSRTVLLNFLDVKMFKAQGNAII
jgi:predicted nuclease of restriction endonuclease-like (RecB) superfamily